MKKDIIILGSTGSVGTQALEVCKEQNFNVIGISGNKNIELLEKQAREFLPKFVVIGDEQLAKKLRLNLADTNVKVTGGKKAVEELAASSSDITLNAISGIAGLKATLSILNSGNQLALANKEALVVGGELVMNTAKTNGTTIYPVDSEHSAIWQSLQGSNRKELSKVFLTASGGPFLGKTLSELEKVTVEQALAHPNWDMGSKISIDSATLMNKGLEFIEAMWLFDLDPGQIEIIVHKESIIHSAVEFIDGSVIAQLGEPDMRVPIQYAFTYPNRLPLSVKRLSFTDTKSLTFAEPDYRTFSGLQTCIDAASEKGLMPCVVNGANEEAVALFLDRKISFLQINDLVTKAFNQLKLKESVTLDNIEHADKLARQIVRESALN